VIWYSAPVIIFARSSGVIFVLIELLLQAFPRLFIYQQKQT
jgi:hypothetical protein